MVEILAKDSHYVVTFVSLMHKSDCIVMALNIRYRRVYRTYKFNYYGACKTDEQIKKHTDGSSRISFHG